MLYKKFKQLNKKKIKKMRKINSNTFPKIFNLGNFKK